MNNSYDPNQKRDGKGRWTKDEAAIQKKKYNLIPIEIKGSEIPQFETKKELAQWAKGIFEQLGSVNIADTNIEVKLTGSSAKREASKMRATREENKAIFQHFKDVVEKSIKFDERKTDERHIHDQDLYFNKISIDGKPYNVELVFDYLAPNKEYRYAGHKVNNIKIAPSYLTSYNERQATGANNSINDFTINFNPDITKHEVDNAKEQEMALLEELKKLINTVENDKGENMVDNEKTDKRKLIDEIGGILKGKVDEELWRTIIGKAEKIAYDKSERGTADNEGNKNKEVDNEKVDKRDLIRQIMAIAGKHEDNEEVRTIAKLAEKLAYDKSEAGTSDNKKVKNELEDDKKDKADNKCDNSVNNGKIDFFEQLNKVYNTALEPPKQDLYVSQADRLAAADEYFK